MQSSLPVSAKSWAFLALTFAAFPCKIAKAACRPRSVARGTFHLHDWFGRQHRDGRLLEERHRRLRGTAGAQGADNFKELTFPERKAIQNLKYYTWVGQQGKACEELNAQWNLDYWRELFEDEVAYFDQLIGAYNQLV